MAGGSPFKGREAPRGLLCREFAVGLGSVSSLMEIVEERKRAWALEVAKRARRASAIYCGSAVFGKLQADGSYSISPEEAPNCRSLCRALLHKHGPACDDSADPYSCLLGYRSDRWFPEEYKEHCFYSKPSLQQPDFERSVASEDCMRKGMEAWLALTRRGGDSWEAFLSEVPPSCTFTRARPESSRVAARAQATFPESAALMALSKVPVSRFYIISRRQVSGSAAEDAGPLMESAIVPGDYWNALEDGERADWLVTTTFVAPTEVTALEPLQEALTGRREGKAICLFRVADVERVRFGMIPGDNCRGFIGVLYVAALEADPAPGFDAASRGFDLCVARRVFQRKVMLDGSSVEALQLRTRVTVGSPCGVESGMDKGFWEVAFYALRYPQARGVEGQPPGGECPWKGSIQLSNKCFLRLKTERDMHQWDFFSANAVCRAFTVAQEHVEGLEACFERSLPPSRYVCPPSICSRAACQGASLGRVGVPRSEGGAETRFLSMPFSTQEMAAAKGEEGSWIGLFQASQLPLVVPGRSSAFRRKEAECPMEAPQSADGTGSLYSQIRAACPAAAMWPQWRPVSDGLTAQRWDPLFCDGQPQALDGAKFADCAVISFQKQGAPPCLKARSCDAPLSAICSVKLRTGPQVLAKGSRGSGELPVVSCSTKNNAACWISLALPAVDWWTDSLALGTPKGRHSFPFGHLALMAFCGSGSLLAGPWTPSQRLNLAKDKAFRELDAGSYELCYCPLVRGGEAAATCTEGREFVHLRALLNLLSDEKGETWPRVQILPEVPLKALPGNSNAGTSLILRPEANEISPGVVFCTVGKAARRRTDDTCRFTLESPDAEEKLVTLSIVPVGANDAPYEPAALCSRPGATMTVNVKGITTVDVRPFLPFSHKHAICAQGSLIGTLITSAKTNSAADFVNGLKLKFPHDTINQAVFEVSVSGYFSYTVGSAVLLLVEAVYEDDNYCSSHLIYDQSAYKEYMGVFDSLNLLLLFTVPAPTVRTKLCLLNPNSYYHVEVAAFFPNTIAVKLLQGTQQCPFDPADPEYSTFEGDPSDIVAVLEADAMDMTMTFASTTILEFQLAEQLKPWLADRGIATICMTQEGMEDSTTSCWENETCTMQLGYMRWVGPTESYDKAFVCKEEEECIVDVEGKHMDFLSMHFSRLAALETCGELRGIGTLSVFGTYQSVDLSAPSDDYSWLQVASHSSPLAPVSSASTEGSAGLKAQDHAQARLSLLESASTHSSASVSFVLKTDKKGGTQELCWNPAAGSFYNLLDHTVYVGRIVFVSRPTLKTMEVVPQSVAGGTEGAQAVKIEAEVGLDRADLTGSTKVYLKNAPTTDTALVDTCDYTTDAAGDLITAISAMSAVSSTSENVNLATAVLANPQVPSSVCLVQFMMPTSFSNDIPYAFYMGRLPGAHVPSANLDATCTLDRSTDCTAKGALTNVSALDWKGNPWPLQASPPAKMTVLAAPFDSCPSNPRELLNVVSATERLTSEQILSEFTRNTVSVTLERLSPLLALRGRATLCVLDDNCQDPQTGECVASLGKARWIGPTVITHVDTLCTEVKGGRCKVSITGFNMKSVDYSRPRLAVTSACGDGTTELFTEADEVDVEDDVAVFSVPVLAGWGLHLCWNPVVMVLTPGFDSGGFTLQSEYTFDIGSFSVLPLPIVTGRSVSSKTVTTAVVEVELNALLDPTSVAAFGGPLPSQGLWNGMSREPYSPGSTCSISSSTVYSFRATSVSIETVNVRSREDGSFQETGKESAEAAVTQISFEFDAEEVSYTYCWHTAVFDANHQIWQMPCYQWLMSCYQWQMPQKLRELILRLRTPLVNIAGPSDAQLGGVYATAALSLGFVPCMSGTSDPDACIFSVVATAPSEPDLYPNGETAPLINAETVDPSKPMRLLEPHTVNDCLYYNLGAGRAWLSENGKGTICWHSDVTASRTPVKIAQALWLGPPFIRNQPMYVTCSHVAVCNVSVHGKNFSFMDHSVTRLAVLESCGTAKGLGVAQLRTVKSEHASFLMIRETPSYELVTEDDLEPDRRDSSSRGRATAPIMLQLLGKTAAPKDDSSTKKEVGADQSLADPASSAGSGVSSDKTNGTGASDSANAANSMDASNSMDAADASNSANASDAADSMDASNSANAPDAADSMDATDASSSKHQPQDETISFWVFRGKPGIYEICWNSDITPNADASAYSEYLGKFEMMPILSVTDEAVVCVSDDLSTCTLEITIEVEAIEVTDGSVVLILAAQDGTAECAPVTPADLEVLAIMPHRSSWDAAHEISELTYSTPLSKASRKLCLVTFDNATSTIGTAQYAGNIPGYSAPKEHAIHEDVCTADPTRPCSVTLEPSPVSSFFDLDNRIPQEGETTPSFDAFPDLRAYLPAESRLYVLEGDVLCPASASDKLYTTATEDPASGIAALPQAFAEIGSLVYQLTDAQQRWLMETLVATLCWTAPDCTEDSQMPTSRPCTKKVGVLTWAGPLVKEPLATITCRLEMPCTFVVQGINLALMDHQKSRVAFLKQCGGSEGPGIASVKEYPENYSPVLFKEAAGAASGSGSFLAVNSRVTRHWRDISMHRHSRLTKLRHMHGDPFALLQGIPENAHVLTDSLTVEASQPVDDTVSICWNPLTVPTDNLSDFTMTIGKAIGYTITNIVAFCTSGSLCGIQVETRGAALEGKQLKLRAVWGSCSSVFDSPAELPDGGMFAYVEGQTYAFTSPVAARSDSLHVYELCWCDERFSPDCGNMDYGLTVGSLSVQTMDRENVACLKDDSATCVVSIPDTLRDKSYVYVSEYRESSPYTCVTPLSVVSADGTKVQGTDVEVSIPYSALESAGLIDKPVAICWTGKESPSGKASVPVWEASYLGNIIFVDARADTNMLYAGVPPQISILATGLIGTQASLAGLPLSLKQVYLKDKSKCSATSRTTLSVPLPLERLSAAKETPGYEISFAASTVLTRILSKSTTDVTKLSLCWCNASQTCVKAAEFSSELAQLVYFRPATGVEHQCTYDSTCLMNILDFPGMGKLPFTAQLLIRTDCTDPTPIPELPDEGTMTLREHTGIVSSEETGAHSGLEPHAYGFESLVIREQALAKTQQLRKRICYCSDSTDCSPKRLMDIGELVITDVWDTDFRISVVARIDVPLTIKAPLTQKSDQRQLVVARGDFLEPCNLENDATKCSISLRDFPKETWESEQQAILQIYDPSLPKDPLDSRPIPFVRIASLTPAGPWEPDQSFFCQIGGLCEVTVEVLNRRATDRIALLQRCGEESRNSIGLSAAGEKVEGRAIAARFQWTARLSLSPAEMEAGMEVCWKALERATEGTDALVDYSAKFGTVSIRGIFPGQNALCFIGSTCTVDGLKAQHLVSGNQVLLLKGGCGSEGTELPVIPNGGIMTISSSSETSVTLSIPEVLPARSLVMCGCTEATCRTAADHGWRIGELSLKGPDSQAPHLEVSARVDIRMTLSGDFDDKFFLQLKKGTSCTTGTADATWPSQGFAPIFENQATWKAFDEGLGPLSVCLCHNSEGEGLSDSSSGSQIPLAVCEDPDNYVTKVGQIFVSGPLKQHEAFSCRTGAICIVQFRRIGLDSDAARKEWTSTQVYTQKEDCSIAGTVLHSGGIYISDTEVGEKIASDDPAYPIVYETRESVFLFRHPVELGAGSYSLCWKPEGGTVGITLGTFSIEGPLTEHKLVPVVIGKKFDVSVAMNSVLKEEDLQYYRIWAHPYKGDDVFEDFDCKSQMKLIAPPDAADCTFSNGPPTALKLKDTGSVLVWENVCVVGDELEPDATAGDKYAVCFCDGHLMGCSTADRFQTLVQAWHLTGPLPIVRETQQRYLAGTRFSLEIEGVGMQGTPVIGLAPAFNVVTNTRYTCRSSEKEVLGKFSGTVSADGTRATFTNVYVPFTVTAGLLCWCADGECEAASDFLVQLSRYGVAGPSFVILQAIVNSYFNVQLVGSTLNRSDAITIRKPSESCGAAGTESMDATLILPEEGRTLNSLGTTKGFTISENALSGETEKTWTSWLMRIGGSVSGSLKICYCSSLENSCGEPGSVSALAGYIQIRGPAKGDLELVATEEYGEYLIVRGTNLSTRNLLRYFQYSSSEVAPTAEEEATICSNPINVAGGVTTYPEVVNASGTEQYFSVTVTVGKQYVACWSFGEDTTSVPDTMTRSRSAPIFASSEAEDPIDIRRSLLQDDEVTEGSSGDAASGDVLLDADDSSLSAVSAPNKWFFISLFSQTGFQQGVHNIVKGHEDTIVIHGVLNATDTYEAVLGKSHESSECSDILKNGSLRSSISITTASVTESRMVLQ
ncbi:cysteine repeat modular [Cyclospora cayetanensis]|uniref:Cysteine repeat modular n=1 Tax=Cyclospora cayetanensis TaxID=88456 RepID=A0A1D3CXI0_9EIME|nr:cysteine repeat modular [Cyclospora cayetanensis]